MEEAWKKALTYLPPTKYIGHFYLAYRPWIRDKTRRFYVNFLSVRSAINCPWRIEGFGATEEEALNNFCDRYQKWKNKYG